MSDRNERRTTPRLAVHRPLKLHCAQAGLRYFSGHTENLSTRGALIRLQAPLPLSPGQRVQILLPQDAQQVLLYSRRGTEARIVRVLRHDGDQYVAVAFAEPLRMSEAG